MEMRIEKCVVSMFVCVLYMEINAREHSDPKIINELKQDSW